MGQFDALLKPFKIKGLTLRNRVVSSSHAPHYGRDGKPQERYQLYHVEKAKGGVGLTMFGGSSSVSLDSPSTPWNQLSVADDTIIPYFQEFSRRIHEHGAALMIQLTHMGRRTRWDTDNWLPNISASALREPWHRSFPKEMEKEDIRRVISDFSEAAWRCKEGGLDGCEISAAHGHLIDQFWSPSANQRTDEYGGSLENRTRFGLEILEAIRKKIGTDYVVGIRMSGDEMLEGGLTLQDCLAIAKTYAESGLIDFINVLGGQGRDYLTLSMAIPNMAFPVAPYLHLPSAIKQVTSLPIMHAQRVSDVATAARAVEDGHVDLVAMTRAHLADPHIVRKIIEGRVDDIRQCVGAGYCTDRVSMGGDALCIQNPATGREATMPHVIRTATARRKVVVVGAGPAGLEAARVTSARGHKVVLFEKNARLGGQINIASKATWREALSGIPRWLEAQIRKQGVDIRASTTATADTVREEDADVVIIATGGRPNKETVIGGELFVTTWDVLTEAVQPAENVLIFDDHGGHQAASCAEYMAKRGAAVELISPDVSIMSEVGINNFPIHKRELYKLGVMLTVDLRLIEVSREANKLLALLRNEYTHAEEERLVDQVVVEHGTLPNDELYFALKPHSSNAGQLDLTALVAGKAQAVGSGDDSRFQLFRIGDAVAGRNVHAAIYEALRLCKDL
jgi:N,N-dimethylglycine/sarcosine dehydrogenase